MTGAERATALLAELRALADRRAACPADADLAERLDCTEEQLCDSFALLAAAGLIRWHRVIAVVEPPRELERAA